MQIDNNGKLIIAGTLIILLVIFMTTDLPDWSSKTTPTLAEASSGQKIRLVQYHTAIAVGATKSVEATPTGTDQYHMVSLDVSCDKSGINYLEVQAGVSYAYKAYFDINHQITFPVGSGPFTGQTLPIGVYVTNNLAEAIECNINFTYYTKEI